MKQRQSDIIRLELPATYTYLPLLSACIAEMIEQIDSVNDRNVVAYNIQLSAHEVCANIVDHAYEHQDGKFFEVTLTLSFEARSLVIEMHDTGDAFNLASVPKPDLDEVHEHGYGLFLVHSLMDEVVYQSQPDGNHWRLVKYL